MNQLIVTRDRFQPTKIHAQHSQTAVTYKPRCPTFLYQEEERSLFNDATDTIKHVLLLCTEPFGAWKITWSV